MAEWSCSGCTYINDSNRTVCEMCQTAKPISDKSDATTPTTKAPSPASKSVSTSPAPSSKPTHKPKTEPSPMVNSSPGLDKPLSSGKPPGKKGKGGYYHFSSTPAELAESFKPQKIDPSEVEKQEKKKGGIIGLSAWNSKGGTWEEQDLSTWAQEQMKGKLGGRVDCGGDAIELDVKEVSGRCSVIYSRGKAKLGFELSVKGEFQGKIGGSDVTGKVELSNLDETCYQDEDDYEIEVSGGSSAARKGLLAHFMKQFTDFVAEVKQEAEG